jgi:hypothetical protein
MRQLTLMTVWCRIITLQLPCRYDDINRQDAESLADLLTQCPALAHLNLRQHVLCDTGVRETCESDATVHSGCVTSISECWGSAQRSLTSIAVGIEVSSFVTWPSLWPSFAGSLHCFFFAICLAERQQGTTTHCTPPTAW